MSEAPPRTVVHIGFNKTGTTTLQRHVFARQEGWRYAGPDTDEALMDALARNLWARDDREYWKDTVAGYLADLRRGPTPIVVSHEGFGWHPHEGRTARRLHELVPDAHILVVVREQRSMARSLYFMYLSRGGVLPFAEWARSERFRAEKLCFDRTIGDYRDAFGAERVRTLAYEDLVADPTAFLREVVAFVGPEPAPDPSTWGLPLVNRSLSPAGLDALRTVNRWFVSGDGDRRPVVSLLDARGPQVRWLRTLDRQVLRRLPGRDDDRDLPEDVLDAIGASNACLEPMTGLDLRARGYVVGPSRPGPRD